MTAVRNGEIAHSSLEIADQWILYCFSASSATISFDVSTIKGVATGVILVETVNSTLEH